MSDVARQQQKRTWGVLAYIVGDQEGLTDDEAREIDAAATEEAQKLVRAARGLDDVYLSVHVDLTREEGSRIYRVPGDREPIHIREDRADIESLARFVRQEKDAHPTDHHIVILWGHSAGPLGLFADPDGGPGTGHVPLTDLSKILPALKKPGESPIDILLVKSCYMATLEAANEVEELARFMICSQARVPMRTWTIWEDVFESIDPGPQLQPDDDPVVAMAREILVALDRHYSDVTERNGHDEVPFSLLRTRGMVELKDKFTALFKALKPFRDDEAVLAAIEDARPREGGDPALLDVRRLCANLGSAGHASLAKAAAALDDAIRPALIVANTPLVSRFGGVGLFNFPPDPLLRVDSFANEVTQEFYATLTFPRTTDWKDVAYPDRTDDFALASSLVDAASSLK